MHVTVADQVNELLEALSRCREYCKVQPHNDWDSGIMATTLDGTSGIIVFTCQVCGRKKAVPA